MSQLVIIPEETLGGSPSGIQYINLVSVYVMAISLIIVFSLLTHEYFEKPMSRKPLSINAKFLISCCFAIFYLTILVSMSSKFECGSSQGSHKTCLGLVDNQCNPDSWYPNGFSILILLQIPSIDSDCSRFFYGIGSGIEESEFGKNNVISIVLVFNPK